MEENVALDSKKQRKFVKSIKGIKKLFKKNEGKAEPQNKDEKVEPKKPFSMRLKYGKASKKRKHKERGLVYLSHIPHGFYEEFNAAIDDIGELKRARKLLSNLNKNKKKLNEMGVNYDFFTPVDVPEAECLVTTRWTRCLGGRVRLSWGKQ